MEGDVTGRILGFFFFSLFFFHILPRALGGIILLLRYESPAPFLRSEICGTLGGTRFSQHVGQRYS